VIRRRILNFVPPFLNLMSRISVIIPTYNRADRVIEAVRCVLDQTFEPFEVIVIDDGSTDDTEQALASVRERIRYIKTPNRGVSAARNRGILEATGEWIAFLDSDDAWHPEKLEKQMACARRTKAAICFCLSVDESGASLDGLDVIDPSLAGLPEKSYPAGDCLFFKHSHHPFLQSMLVRKEAVMKSGLFDETLRVAEDTKFIYRLVLDHSYAVLNERMALICRQRDAPGLSDTLDPESALRRFDCYTRVQAEAFWRVLPIDLQAASAVRGNMLYFASRASEIACALGNRTLARRYAAAALDRHATLKCVVRSLLILLAYPVAESRFTRKWKT
jgi:glycosyltransferase involved in cell wall biosynthesis